MLKLRPTKAWLRVKKQIDEYSRSSGVKIDRAPAMRAERLSENPIQEQQLAVLENPTSEDGKKKMAKRRTAKQRAATKKMIAASARKRRGGRRRKPARRRKAARRRPARRRMRANPVAKSAAGRRRQRAASKRNIKKAQRARRRSTRVRSRVGAIRKAAGRGGVRLVRVRPASTPIVIEEKVKRRKPKAKRRRRKASIISAGRNRATGPLRMKRRKKALLANPKRRRRSRRRSYQSNNLTFRDKRSALLENPRGGFNGLSYDNPTFNISAIQAAGVAGFGVGLGLVVAEFVDRYVATRKPTDGVQPWYGANAAAAVNRRPDAWRLGAQAVGGVGAIGLAYLARGRSVLPFLFGGTAVGFFANLTKDVIMWWGAPMVLKTKDGAEGTTEATLANRLLPLEQKYPQDLVDGIFEKWKENSVLLANQADPPVVPSVAPGSGRSMLGRRGGNGNALGKARTQAEAGNGQVGRPVLVPTGRLGMCDTCGGDNGCWSDCEDLTLCGDCGDHPVARRCEYTLKPGDDLTVMARQYGIDVNQIQNLNGSLGAPPGTKVVLPYAMCRAMQSGPMLHGTPESVTEAPDQVPVPPPVAQSSVPYGLAELPDDL